MKKRYSTAKTAGLVFLIIIGLFIVIQAVSGTVSFWRKVKSALG